MNRSSTTLTTPLRALTGKKIVLVSALSADKQPGAQHGEAVASVEMQLLAIYPQALYPAESSLIAHLAILAHDVLFDIYREAQIPEDFADAAKYLRNIHAAKPNLAHLEFCTSPWLVSRMTIYRDQIVDIQEEFKHRAAACGQSPFEVEMALLHIHQAFAQTLALAVVA